MYTEVTSSLCIQILCLAMQKRPVVVHLLECYLNGGVVWTPMKGGVSLRMDNVLAA